MLVFEKDSSGKFQIPADIGSHFCDEDDFVSVISTNCPVPSPSGDVISATDLALSVKRKLTADERSVIFG